MFSDSTVTAAQAPLPEAVAAVQRRLSGGIVYPLLTRLGDSWAGWRDAKLIRAMLEKDRPIGVTPWMSGLHNAFFTCVDRERRDTTALEAPLREEAARLIARHKVLTAEAAALQTAAGDAAALPADAHKPTTSGEALEDPKQIRYRRQREASARAADARASAARAAAERDAIPGRLAELTETHQFHEAAYIYRVAALHDFHARRQAVYLRRALRGLARLGGSNELPQMKPPEIKSPDWEIHSPHWKPAPFPTLDEDQK